MRFINNIKNRIEAGGGKITLAQLDADRKSIGQFVRQYEQKRGGSIEHVTDDIYASFYDDLKEIEKIGGEHGEAATNLKTAIEASRKTFAKEDFSALIEKNIKFRSGDNIPMIDLKTIRNKLKNSPLGNKIQKSIEPDEWETINSALNKLAEETPGLPPARGAQFGSGKFTSVAGIVYGLSRLFGIEPASASAIAGAAGSGPYMINPAFITYKKN